MDQPKNIFKRYVGTRVSAIYKEDEKQIQVFGNGTIVDFLEPAVYPHITKEQWAKKFEEKGEPFQPLLLPYILLDNGQHIWSFDCLVVLPINKFDKKFISKRKIKYVDPSDVLTTIVTPEASEPDDQLKNINIANNDDKVEAKS